MANVLYTCLCCNESKSGGFFKPGAVLCNSCATLDSNTLLITARARWEASQVMRTSTKAGRRMVKRAELLAKIRAEGKRCTSCHGYKEPDAYAVCEARLDGLQPECKACGKVRAGLLASGTSGRSTWYTVRDAMRAQSAKPAPRANKKK